jgi:hypothetical protein
MQRMATRYLWFLLKMEHVLSRLGGFLDLAGDEVPHVAAMTSFPGLSAYQPLVRRASFDS